MKTCDINDVDNGVIMTTSDVLHDRAIGDDGTTAVSLEWVRQKLCRWDRNNNNDAIRVAVNIFLSECITEMTSDRVNVHSE